jgi:hypothetical protein
MDMMAPRIGGMRDCEKCKGFVPHPHFEVRVPNAKLVFVGSMCDLFCKGVLDEWIERVLEIVRQHPHQDFLFCTQNPARYFDFLGKFPENAILGATIQTNRDELVKGLTGAPLPSERYEALFKFPHKRKFWSAEPIMDFDLEIFLGWIVSVRPEVCEIGYDNYPKRTFKKLGRFLVEPIKSKVEKLIDLKRRAGIDTREKTIRKAWFEDGI